MAFMLMVIENGEERRTRPLADGQRLMDRMSAYAESLQKRGVLRLAEALRSDAVGVRIAARSGKRTVTDGPFTESKEMVGGIFLLDVKTREEALAIAHECPAVEWATVEVRELGPCFT